MPVASVEGTPFYIPADAGGDALWSAVGDLTERVELLRRQGILAESTLRNYYGDKRFEQIAESNSIEGSTLDIGETQLAVVKGITISGHDPAYSRDAQSLARALDELTNLAGDKNPTDITQVKQIHSLVLGVQPGAGMFRNQEVRISGSKLRPPKSIREVLDQMTSWETWSVRNGATPPILRATLLHAWLAHIHPFVDGNGRTARAITNLELVRAGYPPLIIRRRDRDQYLDSLAQADEGDLGPFFELLAGRLEDALRDLERAASKGQAYNLQREKRRRIDEGRLAIWNAGVHLLVERIRLELLERADAINAEVVVEEFQPLSVDDFTELCDGRAVRSSWAFRIRCRSHGHKDTAYLAWAGFLGRALQTYLQEKGTDTLRPALMWSVPTGSFPPWRDAGAETPFGLQLTLRQDRWVVCDGQGVRELSSGELAAKVAENLADRLMPAATL